MVDGAAGRQYWPESYHKQGLSPRVKLALRLYHTGLVKTKAEAADLSGLSRSAFYIITTTNPAVTNLAHQIDQEIMDETIDTSRLLKRLGREALGTIARTMRNPLVKPEVQLKAAQDLADRSPETSKVVNINAHVSTPMSDEQVATLRAAMIEGALLREKFPAAASGSFITVDDKSTAKSLELVRENAPKALPAGQLEEE